MSEIKPATQELSIRAGHPADERRVEEITTEILRQKGNVVCSFIRIGQLLDEAKGRLKKEGQWLKWLETSVDISVRMAQRYIQLAKAFPDATSVSHLGMTKALALLALPEGQRENFINEPHKVNGKQKWIDNMSVREVRHTIQEQMKSAQDAQETETDTTIGKSDDFTDETSAEGDGTVETGKKAMCSKPTSDSIGQEPRNLSEAPSLETLAADIESVQTHLDGILNVLESQKADDALQEKIADDLRSLYETIRQCMTAANLNDTHN